MPSLIVLMMKDWVDRDSSITDLDNQWRRWALISTQQTWWSQDNTEHPSVSDAPPSGGKLCV
ncbi:putative major tail protein [Salmonella phage 41]|nr:putative major tail protein [Salmonella phage 41]